MRNCIGSLGAHIIKTLHQESFLNTGCHAIVLLLTTHTRTQRQRERENIRETSKQCTSMEEKDVFRSSFETTERHAKTL